MHASLKLEKKVMLDPVAAAHSPKGGSILGEKYDRVKTKSDINFILPCKHNDVMSWHLPIPIKMQVFTHTFPPQGIFHSLNKNGAAFSTLQWLYFFSTWGDSTTV